MSDASRHAAHLVKEVTYGVTPASPAFTRVRHTGMTVGVQRGSLQSEELRPDRQMKDFRLGMVTVAGDINTELSFGAFDDMLEAVLCGTWAPRVTKTAITLSASTTDDSFSDSASGFVGFLVGDLIQTSGFVTSANNGVFKVAISTSAKLTVTNPDGTAAALIATEAAGASVTIKTLETFLTAGTVRRSFSLLRHFTDIDATGEGKPYHLFNGVEFNSVAFTLSPTAIVSAKFSVLGRQGIDPSNTPPAGSTFTDALENEPMDAFSGEVLDGVTPLGIVTECSFTLENGLAAKPVVGSKFSLEMSIGRSDLKGSATTYFEDASFLSKFINEDDSALSFDLPDADGNSYEFIFPKIKYTGGQPDVSNQGAITIATPFQGLLDTVSGSNIIIRRKPVSA